MVNGFDSETNATGPIAYFYKEINANSWTKIDSEIMPKGAADEITIIGNNKLMFRFGPELYTATIGDVIPISNEQAEDRIPKSFTLHANYPNPFNPTTQLSFELSTPGKTTVSVYSITGQKVQTLELGTLSAGAHQATFDATNLPSGVYLYTVKSGNSLRSGKMTLIK